MQFNWIDGIILATSGYYVLSGWNRGLVRLSGGLLSFLGALWLAVRLHGGASAFLADRFLLPSAWAEVVGYLAIAIIAQAILLTLIKWLTGKLPYSLSASRANRWLGAVLSIVTSLVVTTFLLLVLLALPLRGSVKRDIGQSWIGGQLVAFVQTYAGSAQASLNVVAREAVKFLTIKPESYETIVLTVHPKSSQLRVDEASEQRMFELINAERAAAGIRPLVADEDIAGVARAHSLDMFQRRYFSHVNPDGEDMSDRLEEGAVGFFVAGENLAYAPDTITAHEGLMGSEGHRRNILDPAYNRVGIGVIDAGIWGRMFTQNFTN